MRPSQPLSHHLLSLILAAATFTAVNSTAADYDVVIRNGTVYDGSGNKPVKADVALRGDRVVRVGRIPANSGVSEINAAGMAVSPGFINMLSWANESLIQDPHGDSDIRQGVTLEVMGEGESMGPLNEKMKQEMLEAQGDIHYKVEWSTLGEYLAFLEKKGVALNVASFVGATTLRVHEVGYADRAATPEELDRMCKLARKAMEEGALGIGSSLIYAPAFYSKTDELIALCKAVKPYGGSYISHMRSEGNRLLEALDELLTISKESGIPAEIYHLKAAGKNNWAKMSEVIKRIEAARKSGLDIRADMYTYTAGATGLDAAMPPWVQEGGYKAWAARLKDPKIREQVAKEMATPTDKWESLYLAAGSPEQVLLVGFKNDALKPLTGKSLAEVAKMRGKSPEETAMDLVVEDGSRVSTVYFLMSEDNVRKQVKLPWVSFGSDEGTPTPEGVFLKSNPHPRAYGNFSRLLGKYVREEKLITLEQAIHRLAAMPAANLKLDHRGLLKEGYYADVVVFDPKAISDHATFDKPHQLATGVAHVFVNGVQVLKDGNHTRATPGRFVKGPGYKAK